MYDYFSRSLILTNRIQHSNLFYLMGKCSLMKWSLSSFCGSEWDFIHVLRENSAESSAHNSVSLAVQLCLVHSWGEEGWTPLLSSSPIQGTSVIGEVHTKTPATSSGAICPPCHFVLCLSLTKTFR